MGFVIIFAASIPAYLAAGLALVFGAGWLMSLGVLALTGIVASLLLVAMALRGRPDTTEVPALTQTA